jgi:hypothetical protein
MKKEEIYVVIDSEEKRLRAIKILSDAGEKIWHGSDLLIKFKKKRTLHFYKDSWCLDVNKQMKNEISLDQLEQMLNPQFVVKEIVLPLEELQKQAELLGWKLVKEERQIKVGDFGKFWDNDEKQFALGILYKIDTNGIYWTNDVYWTHFVHLTNEEKQQIQENW